MFKACDSHAGFSLLWQFKEAMFLSGVPFYEGVVTNHKLSCHLLYFFLNVLFGLPSGDPKTLHPYSMVGMTNVLKHFSLTLHGHPWRFRC